MRHRLQALPFVAIALVACAGSESSTTTNAQVISTVGGSVWLSDGPGRGARVEVPTGALDAPTRISIELSTSPAGLPSNVEAAGPMIVLAPEGQTFRAPVRVTLPTDGRATAALTRPRGAGPWAEVPSAERLADGALRLSVSHFSEFIAVRSAPDGGGVDAGERAPDVRVIDAAEGCVEAPGTSARCDGGADASIRDASEAEAPMLDAGGALDAATALEDAARDDRPEPCVERPGGVRVCPDASGGGDAAADAGTDAGQAPGALLVTISCSLSACASTQVPIIARFTRCGGELIHEVRTASPQALSSVTTWNFTLVPAGDHCLQVIADFDRSGARSPGDGVTADVPARVPAGSVGMGPALTFTAVAARE